MYTGSASEMQVRRGIYPASMNMEGLVVTRKSNTSYRYRKLISVACSDDGSGRVIEGVEVVELLTDTEACHVWWSGSEVERNDFRSTTKLPSLMDNRILFSTTFIRVPGLT